MEVFPDFRELLALFNAHHVEFLVVGAYALAFYGAPRYTGDLDLLVHPNRENAERIVQALTEFGFGSLGLKHEDFNKLGAVIQLGVAPVRVDLMTSLTGVSWEDAFLSREPGTYGDVPVYFIGKPQFILNKRALGRNKDLADLEAIGELE